jgi:hypothetical protein
MLGSKSNLIVCLLLALSTFLSSHTPVSIYCNRSVTSCLSYIQRALLPIVISLGSAVSLLLIRKYVNI